MRPTPATWPACVLYRPCDLWLWFRSSRGPIPIPIPIPDSWLECKLVTSAHAYLSVAKGLIPLAVESYGADRADAPAIMKRAGVREGLGAIQTTY
jgi:hypothetical protein